MNKIEANFTLNGAIVNKLSEFCGLVIYSEDYGDADSKLYFTKNGEVIKILDISASCSQNTADLCYDFEDI